MRYIIGSLCLIGCVVLIYVSLMLIVAHFIVKYW